MDNNKLQETKRRYNIVGNSDALNRSLDVALQVAPTDLSVLVSGESGVGKEVIPRLIHDNSPRRHEMYFAINCGSIPEGTIDSELFGHEKGSFTSAIGESSGYFGVANRGTIFLDEVGELPMATQARLLRVLETGEYIRVGGQKVMKTDVRIVAATNVNLLHAISEGRFREDLYYRLSTIPIKVPALRERGDDIVLLFRLFALQMAEKYHMPKITLTDDARRILVNYKWPGNVRQLKNVTEQMSVLSPRREIDADTMRQFIPDDRESMQLARLETSSEGSFANEREMLYKILFDMKKNVDTLKSEMKVLRNEISEQRSLSGLAGFNTPTREEDFAIEEKVKSDAAASNEVFMEAEEVTEPQITNLKDLTRETLSKVLERNGGNRRKTAEQLGISSRTLYRKLGEMGVKLLVPLLMVFTLSGCAFSGYKFNGASIDYNVTKTIQINDFPNRSSYIWGPMASMFNNELKDEFASHTKLTQVKRGGDLVIDGEITQYSQRNKSVSSEGYSAMTELAMTVNVRFTNTKNMAENFEQQFTANSSYETTQSLNSVQEELVTEMIEDLVDQIFNATVANW